MANTRPAIPPRRLRETTERTEQMPRARRGAPRSTNGAAAVEIGEIYQSKSRSYIGTIRWVPVFIVVLNVFVLIIAAIDGDELRLILSAIVVLGGAADLMFSPLVRPKNMARAVEGTRWVEAMRVPD